jgi:ketosteroid isomerase-like protein
MRTLAIALSLCAFTLAIASTTQAQTKSGEKPHAHAPAATSKADTVDLAPGTEAAVSAGERFGAALKAGDMKAVAALLDPKVLILESGGAERSREEYLSHHAISDAAFLKDTHSQLLRRSARRDGDTVWIGSESELHASKDGKPLTLSSTETMILRQAGSDWRIVHIHWSSRPKK